MPTPIVEVYQTHTAADQEVILQAILRVQHAAYPPSWHYENEETYFRNALTNPEAINLLVRIEGAVMAYLLAVPLRSVLQDIAPYDPAIASASPDAYYIDDLAAIPGRGYSILRRILRTLESELHARSVHTLTMHARVNTGLSRVLRAYFGNRIITNRRIENWAWYNSTEPTEYIEVAVGNRAFG